MIYSFLHAILIFESPYFTELASLATYFSITLVIGCFTYFPMLHSSLDAILAYESYFTELAFKCYSHLRNPLLHGARFEANKDTQFSFAKNAHSDVFCNNVKGQKLFAKNAHSDTASNKVGQKNMQVSFCFLQKMHIVTPLSIG